MARVKGAPWVVLNEIVNRMIRVSEFKPSRGAVKDLLAGMFARGLQEDRKSGVRHVGPHSKTMRLSQFEVGALLEVLMYLLSQEEDDEKPLL